MTDLIVQIYEFNKAAGLLDKPYDDFLESSFQIEEALEGFGNISTVFYALEPENEISNKQARDCSRAIVAHAMGENNLFSSLSDIERLDKACDAVVFAIGSMAKLRLTPDQISEALNIVMLANMQKLTMPKDEHGKLMKNDNFVGPEDKLQQLLNKRTT